MLVAICRTVVDKSKEFETLATSFTNEDLKVLDLAHEINQGHAFTAHHKGRRNSENFTGAGFIALDFDKVKSYDEVDEIMARPGPIGEFWAIQYHTPSATDDNPRFRPIYPLEQPIFDGNYYSEAVEALQWKAGHADPACKDPCRFYYGFKGSKPIIREDCVLPTHILVELIKEYRAFKEAGRLRFESQRRDPRPSSGLDKGKTKYLELILQTHCQRISSALDGDRHTVALTSSEIIGGYIVGEGMDESEAEQRLFDASMVFSGANQKERIEVIRFGITKGKKKPLYIPVNPDFNRYNPDEDFHKSTHFDEAVPTREQTTDQRPESYLKKLFRHVDELKDLPLPEWLIKPILLRNSIAFLCGDTQTYKSFQAVDWAMSLSQNESVAYIAGEGNSGYSTRVEAWKKYHQKQAGQLYFSKQSLHPADVTQMPAILEAMRELRPAFIVIDTLARSAIGLNENDQRDMGLFVEALAKLRDATGACILVVHHTNRGGSERGSSALKDGADTWIKCEAVGGKDSKLVKVSCEKQKDRKNFEEYHVQAEIVELPEIVYSDGDTADSLIVLQTDPGVVAGDTGKVIGNMRYVLEALAEEVFSTTGANGKRLQEYLNWENASKKAELYRVLSKLLKAGLITQGSKGEPYRITQAGLDIVTPQDVTTVIEKLPEIAHTIMAAIEASDDQQASAETIIAYVSDSDVTLRDRRSEVFRYLNELTRLKLIILQAATGNYGLTSKGKARRVWRQ
jgi:hypothetical protein